MLWFNFTPCTICHFSLFKSNYDNEYKTKENTNYIKGNIEPQHILLLCALCKYYEHSDSQFFFFEQVTWDIFYVLCLQASIHASYEHSRMEEEAWFTLKGIFYLGK